MKKMTKDIIMMVFNYLLRETGRYCGKPLEEGDITGNKPNYLHLIFPWDSFMYLFKFMGAVLDREQQIRFLQAYSKKLEEGGNKFEITEEQILKGSFAEVAEIICANCVISAYGVKDFKELINLLED